ncbi:hypothetical protein [Sinorhizobium meliloti]|uniref:hypothetical protein n=1 Tax=Rhizobium meliloti TaxID=382 RepID=UPI0013922981|nr:hypothetical protein [Sinorhizobium meliloti]MDE3771097.1 hypothetical protein [Sinorhizobium meliloti]
MSDDNIIKFERPKPKQEPRSVGPMQRKALTWLALIAGLFLVSGMGVLPFRRAAELALKGSVHAPGGKLISRAAASGL